jgi:AcrR family transcriptional regulator
MCDTDHSLLLSEGDPPAKRAIVTAALDLFAERGIDGVSVRDIAARTGFTNPALFRHFRTKDELAYWLFETSYRAIAVQLDGQRGRNLEDTIARSLALIERAPECVHYVFENLRRFFRQLPADLRARSLLGTMRRLIEEEARAGRVRADVDPSLAAAVIVGALAQIARMAYFDELPKPPGQLAADLVGLITRGIGT